jgi:regulator of protease activity HflC (stomatin/prohibitin superfamily)
MRRWGVYGAVALVAVWAIGNSYYVVEPNEVGAVTRMGSLVSEAPAPPGFHLKLPFIDTAYKVRTSIEKIPIPDVKAKTTDNQFVGVDLNITYHTQDPFRVLFKVGEVGPEGVHDKVIPYVQSRVLDAIGKVNALEIANQKSAIEANILKDIRTPVLELFGEFVDDVQITAIDYDPVFKQGVEKMVQTRNDQIAAQNVLVITKTQAETAAAKAKGEADAVVNAAEGEKQKAIKARRSASRPDQAAGRRRGLRDAGQSQGAGGRGARSRGRRGCGDREQGRGRRRRSAVPGHPAVGSDEKLERLRAYLFVRRRRRGARRAADESCAAQTMSERTGIEVTPTRQAQWPIR